MTYTWLENAQNNFADLNNACVLVWKISDRVMWEILVSIVSEHLVMHFPSKYKLLTFMLFKHLDQVATFLQDFFLSYSFAHPKVSQGGEGKTSQLFP